MKKSWWVFVFVSPMVAILGALAHVYYGLYLWQYRGPEQVFEVHKGEPFSKINHRLAQRKIIYSSKLFHRYGQFKGHLTEFQVGEYTISPGMNMAQVVDKLARGEVIKKSVTIVEGKNIHEMANILTHHGLCSTKEYWALVKSQDLMDQYQIQGKTLEGYLYPDTYTYAEGMGCQNFLEKMLKTFFQKIKTLDFSQTHLNQREVIILASIVEKETGAPHERPIISGVFHNRLKKRMRLQSDPTTIYGFFETFKGNLRKKDLTKKTPYNTYRINGLPIGPISNPGLDSIKAVLAPQKHNYLFFVSQNDGTHVFSKTYKEHLGHVRTYQLDPKRRKGKSWRDLQRHQR